jgi:hypothetical protein
MNFASCDHRVLGVSFGAYCLSAFIYSFKGCFFRLSPYSVMGDSRSRNRFS